MIKNFGKLALLGSIAYTIIIAVAPASAQRLRIIENGRDYKSDRDYEYDRDYRYHRGYKNERGYRYDDDEYEYDDDDYEYDDDDYEYDDDDDDYKYRRNNRNQRRYRGRGKKYKLYGGRLICETTPRGFTHCRTNDFRKNDYTRLQRQLEKNSLCREAYRWGRNRRDIWVSEACRNAFDIVP